MDKEERGRGCVLRTRLKGVHVWIRHEERG